MPIISEELKKFVDAFASVIGRLQKLDDDDAIEAEIKTGVKELKTVYESGYRVFRDRTQREVFENDMLSTLEEHLENAKILQRRMKIEKVESGGLRETYKGVEYSVYPMLKQGKCWAAVAVVRFPDGEVKNSENGDTMDEAMENAKKSAFNLIDKKLP